MQKHDVMTKYNLPAEVRYCKTCVMSNQRPRITFDDEGVCSACNFSDYKRTQIDWSAREAELAALCDKHRKSDGSYDVIVLSVEAKRQDNGTWEVYTDCGRERSGLNVVDWVRRGVDLGAGEIMLTSIDREGTRRGYDYRGVTVTAAIRRDNVTGVQFHPEKSGDVGLTMIRNFVGAA